MLVGRPRPFREGPVARPGAAGPPPPDARRPRSAHPRPGRQPIARSAGTKKSTYTSAHSTPYLPDAASPRPLPRRGPRHRQPCGQPALRPLRPPPARAAPDPAGGWHLVQIGWVDHPPHVSLRRQATRANVPVGGHVMAHRDRLMWLPLGMICEYRWTVSPRRGGGGLAGRRRGSRSGIRPRCRPGRSSTCGGRCGRSPGGRRVRRCR